MSSAFKYNFNVYGKTPFPVVMLSMEGCFPTTVADGGRIMASHSSANDYLPLLENKAPEREPVTVNLTIITTDRNWQPKIDHWNKQGWTVGVTRAEYNEKVI